MRASSLSATAGLTVDARLVWFPDENHWILKPRNSRLWYDEYFGWLERHAPARG